MRNYEFFGTPTVALVAQDRSLTPVDAMCIGLYLQTPILALTENSVGTCVEVSVTLIRRFRGEVLAFQRS